MIQEYVEKHYGFKAHITYITEIKRKLGLQTYLTPNAAEKKKHHYYSMPPYKAETIIVKLKERAVGERTLTDEDTISLTMKGAKEEAIRCMNRGCYSVNASNISPVLVVIDGTVVITKKRITAKDFFTTKLKCYDMLNTDEIVTAAEIPELKGYQTGYIKDRLRPSSDFILVSVAYTYNKIEDIKLAFGGAIPVSIQLYEAEKFFKDKGVT